MKSLSGLQSCVVYAWWWVALLASMVMATTAAGRSARITDKPETSPRPFLPVGSRFPPSRPDRDALEECRDAGAICAGPFRSYPIGRQPGVVLSSLFTVPDLPQEFDPVNTTYYDYFNIYWPGSNMNQFVPQLMLGNALANSSNHPNYDPYWIEMKTWHIGEQYFMGVCPTSGSGGGGPSSSSPASYCDGWIPKAATGRLIPVHPGELIETSFRLVVSETNQWIWHLRMGVVGQPHRRSVVVAEKPFMGLVEGTESWDEDAYENVVVGCCLENYGMESARNYPPTWEVTVDVEATGPGTTFWQQWTASSRTNHHCPWQPQSTVRSIHAITRQMAVWNATLAEGGVGAKNIRDDRPSNAFKTAS